MCDIIPSSLPRCTPPGKDTEVVHGLPSWVHQAAHACPLVSGGQPGQHSSCEAVVKEQGVPLQQQLLVQALRQQPQRHLEQPVTAEVGEPAQAGDKALPGAAAVGVQAASGRVREQRSPPTPSWAGDVGGFYRLAS